MFVLVDALSVIPCARALLGFVVDTRRSSCCYSQLFHAIANYYDLCAGSDLLSMQEEDPFPVKNV